MIGLSIRVTKPAVPTATALFDQNRDWVTKTAWGQINSMAAFLDVASREDWVSDCVTELYIKRNSYDPGRSYSLDGWRAWARSVMRNRVLDLIQNNRRREQALANCATGRVSHLFSEPEALDSVQLEALRKRLIENAQAIAKQDMSVLDALMLDGGEKGALANAQLAAGVGRRGVFASMERIRMAMIETGMVEASKEGDSDDG